MNPLPSLGHQSTPPPLEGVGNVKTHVTNKRIVRSSSSSCHPRDLEEELEPAQMQQSRVQGPPLQLRAWRKEATGSKMGGLKQSSHGFQRHIKRELYMEQLVLRTDPEHYVYMYWCKILQ